MPDIIHYAIPGFIILMIVESIVSSIQDAQLYEAKDTAASLSMGVGNVIIKLFVKVPILASYFAMYEFRFFEMGWSWVAWVLLFFFEDFTYYWFHRFSHKCRFFWASHVNHHSSERYNLSTALRQTWTGSVTGFVFWLWLPLLGFHPFMVATMQAISLLYQFWIHTETIGKLGFLELFMNTPSHHRVHHGSDIKYLDRNHAGVLIIWDKLFGTFQVEEEEVAYGLTKNIKTFNPFKIAFHEWAAIWRDLRESNSWHVRFSYVFGPPGWSHDGSRKTVEELQAEVSHS